MHTLIKWTAILPILISGITFGADTDFTGHWKLNGSRSEVRALPHGPDAILQLRQENITLHCEAIADGGQSRVCTFTVDGTETRNRSGDWIASTRTKWEGAALLRNTICTSRERQHTEMDRWKLSRDGSTLTIRRQIVGPGGEMESTLVYEKAPQTAATP